MRIVEQFVQAILNIMHRRKAGDYLEARALIRTTGKYLLRSDIDLLLLYHHDQIFDHFKDLSHRLETEKCVLGADLLYELALIEESEQHPEAALRLKMLCLHFYTAALPSEQQFQDSRYFEKVAFLVEELKERPFPDATMASLRSYEEFISGLPLSQIKNTGE